MIILPVILGAMLFAVDKKRRLENHWQNSIKMYDVDRKTSSVVEAGDYIK